MFVIKQATTADIPLINKLAWNVFPETYKNILSNEQIEYMMDWMYSIENLHKQMEEGGHRFISSRENLCHSLLSKVSSGQTAFPAGYKRYQGNSSGSLPYGTECKP